MDGLYFSPDEGLVEVRVKFRVFGTFNLYGKLKFKRFFPIGLVLKAQLQFTPVREQVVRGDGDRCV